MAETKFVCVEDYEKHAAKVLPSSTLDYYRGGADQEQTLDDNKAAFKRWRLMPRMLRGVQSRSMKITILGNQVAAPLGLAPSAMQRLAHEEGEIAAVKAAAEQGVVYILSTNSTSSIEEVGSAAPNGNNWFQLYISKNRQNTIDLIRRAERANFKALVLTVDAPLLGRRLASERNKFTLPPHLRLSNLQNKNGEGTTFAAIFDDLLDPSLTWKDIDWLKSITMLPIVVKGILRADDAELAVQHGVAAIAVSNHGARQLDGVQATIDALPAIVKQVAGRCEVYVDGGITQGTDIIKALALGAQMVFIGRPVLWGLAHSGQNGVQSVIQLLKNEFDLAMALSGCSTVNDIHSSLVMRQEFRSQM